MAPRLPRRPRRHGRSAVAAASVAAAAAALLAVAAAAAATRGGARAPLARPGVAAGGVADGRGAPPAPPTANAVGVPARHGEAAARLAPVARTFEVSQLRATFNRFKRSGGCPPTITHDGLSNPSREVTVISHRNIRADGGRCVSASSLIVLSSATGSSADLDALLRDNDLFRGVYDDLQGRASAFLIGYDRTQRVCGRWVFPDDTIVLFLDEADSVNVPGFVNLKPRDGGYMLVFRDGTAQPCAYTSARSGTDIDSGDTAAVAEGAVPVAATPIPTARPTLTPTAAPASPTPTPVVVPVLVPTDDGSTPTPTPSPSPLPDEESEPSPTLTPDEEPDEEPEPSPTLTPTPEPTADADAASPTPTATKGTATATPSAPQVVPDIADGNDFDDGRLGPVDDSACFPADARVALPGGGVKRMADVAVGDVLRTSPTTVGRVYFFSHADARGDRPFLTLTTAAGAAVTLSAGHYLPVRVGGSAAPALLAAAAVAVGDTLTLASGRSSRVTAIADATRVGLYNPHLTGGGGLLVDGVWASELTTAVAPAVATPALRAVRVAAAVAARVGLGGVTLPRGGGGWVRWAPRGGEVVEL